MTLPVRAMPESRDTAGRLVTRGIARAAEPVTITFDGRALPALPGESVAAALTAVGIRSFRRTAAGRPRGLFCGIGVCQDCLVEIDGRSSQRACLAPVRAGMAVRTQDARARRPLAPLAPAPDGPLPEETCDLAVVGAGPAGLAAAVAAARAAPDRRVVVLDERPAPGGQYYKPLGPAHRFAGGRGGDRQFRDGAALVAAARDAGVDLRAGTTVWMARREADGLALGLLADGRAAILRPAALVLAPGAYERPPLVTGWTLPGVLATGALQTLARSYRAAPRGRILIAGNGPLNLQVAAELVAGGATVVAVVESARPMRPGALAALAAATGAGAALVARGLAYRARLAAARVPVLEGCAVTAMDGGERVETATVAALEGPAEERRFAVDAVGLGYGFLPSTELARQLGLPHHADPETGFPMPERDETGATAAPDVWIAGDGGGLGGSGVACAQGALAGLAAARRLGAAETDATARARRAALGDLDRERRFQVALWSLYAPAGPAPPLRDPVLLCRCESVSAGAVRRAIADGARDQGSLKRVTRLGMGRCQGRYCAGPAARLLAAATGRPAPALFAPQVPARPVPAAALAVEKPEWGGHREVAPAAAEPLPGDDAPLPAEADLLVIGAGIVGAATAMYAAGSGLATLVVDRGPPNGEASGGNAGSLHVQLLSFDYGGRAQAGGGPALQTLPLQRDSVALWRELERELAGDFEIAVTGGLMVAEDERQRAFLEAKAAAERGAGIPVDVLGRSEIAALAPALSERMVAAAHCPMEGKINPLKATPAIVAEARRRGARFAAGCAVTAIESAASGFVATTTRGRIRAHRLVIAAGGWTARLGAMLGVRLPVAGAPLQMIVTETAPPLVKQLVAHADRHLTLKQASTGNLIVGGGWPAGTDPATGRPRVLRDSLEGNLWVAARTVPAVAGLHVIRSWAAMNVNIDGAPLLGPIPGHPRAFVAATANGYTLGPLVGRITAALAATGSADRAIAPFTLERFG